MLKQFIIIRTGGTWDIYRLIQSSIDNGSYYIYFSSTSTYENAEIMVTMLNKERVEYDEFAN